MAAIRTVEELSKDPEFSGYYDLEEAHKQELEDMLNTGIRQGKEAGIQEGSKYNVPIGVDTLKRREPINCTQVEGIKSLKVDTNLWVL